jgi:hypothetical protein
VDNLSGLPSPWARVLAVVGALVLAAGLHFGAGFGPIPATGIAAAATMAFGLVLHRRPRPKRVPRGWTDPCLFITAGVAVLALTSVGIGSAVDGGAGWWPVGLLAYRC